jgi:hypothetical protein
VSAVFLKAHGTAEAPLPDRWLEADGALARLRRTGFPRRPRMAPGDRLVSYASVWRRIFMVSEVVGDPVQDGISARWPWAVEIEPLIVVPVLSNAPPVEAIGVAPRSMSQQSHIRLERRHLDLAIEVLASVAG